MILCDQPVSAYYEYVEPYRDSFGLIAQSPHNDRDGGDSSHRIGVFYYGLYLIFKNNEVIVTQIKNDFQKDLKKITIGPGEFIRHPDPSKWYSNPNNFTRDQTLPLIISLGTFESEENKKMITNNLKNIFNNKGFFPNKLKNWTNEEKRLPFDYNDPAGPSDYAVYIRSLKNENWRWYLWISDTFLVGQALIRIGFSHFDKTDTSDDLNFTLHLLQAKYNWPTWWSKLAQYLYFNYKQKVLPTKEMGEGSSGVQSSWNYYFRTEADGPPLHRIYECIIDKELSQINP